MAPVPPRNIGAISEDDAGCVYDTAAAARCDRTQPARVALVCDAAAVVRYDCVENASLVRAERCVARSARLTSLAHASRIIVRAVGERSVRMISARRAAGSSHALVGVGDSASFRVSRIAARNT